jgi:death on curing protein
MTNYPDIEMIYTLHEAILKRAGTVGSVRDFALLHSAIERPKATYAGKSLYPTIWLKAASLLQSLCLNHGFTDGNKRTAWGATKLFLWLNGYHLLAQPKEGADFMVYVDNYKPDIKVIASWLKSHSTKK